MPRASAIFVGLVFGAEAPGQLFRAECLGRANQSQFECLGSQNTNEAVKKGIENERLGNTRHKS